MAISPAARRIASAWQGIRLNKAPVVLRDDIADQVQSHLNHGADPDYLYRLATWTAVNKPSWFDLSLAMRMTDAPQPPPSTAPGPPTVHRRCPCRAELPALAR
ncbi:hypothetical protein ACVW0K_007418 [Streptomyces filamentosus]